MGRNLSLTRRLKSLPNTESASSVNSMANLISHILPATLVVAAHLLSLAQVWVFYRKSRAVEANCACRELNMSLTRLIVRRQ